MIKPFKKIAAVVVVASMLISSLAFVGTALGGTPTGTEAMSVGLALSASEVEPGDIVTVTIRLSNNYNAITMRWPVLYSKAFFELVQTEGTPAVTTPIDNVTAVAGSTTTTEDAGFIPAAYSADTYNALTFQWIAKGNTTDGVGCFNQATAVDCFSFQLRVKDDAEGSGSVLIPSDSTKFYYTGINNPMDATTSYTSATPFNFTFADAQTASIVASDPELVAAEGYDVQTINFDGDDNTYLCGFNIEEIVDNGGDFRDQFVVNNGTFEVSSDTFATGVTVTVKKTNGDVFATYDIIFFGDVTGDGIVDVFDINECSYLANSEVEGSGASLYAADVFVDDEASAMIDVFDLNQLSYLSNLEIPWTDVSQIHAAA